jgi:hypothetical protein
MTNLPLPCILHQKHCHHIIAITQLLTKLLASSLHERNPVSLVEHGKSYVFHITVTLHSAIMDNNLIMPIKNKLKNNKLEESKMISVKLDSIYLFYFENMFWSTVHHQAISTKLGTRCNAMQNSIALHLVLGCVEMV